MRISWGVWTGAAALLLLGFAARDRGPGMFSPGPLNAAPGERIGGVTSHAALGDDCGACHQTPRDPRPMPEHCLQCHTPVRGELLDSTSLHGALGAAACRDCHGEHRGATASLTSMSGKPNGFDHERTGFALAGAHRRASCRACHERQQRLAFGGTSAECLSCHAQKDTHRGEFGTACGECHGTAAWRPASFRHTFPIRHGSRTASACGVCHADSPRSFKTYTCYGCHEHSPARIRAEHAEEGIGDWQDCVRCHSRGEH